MQPEEREGSYRRKERAGTAFQSQGKAASEAQQEGAAPLDGEERMRSHVIVWGKKQGGLGERSKGWLCSESPT